MAVRLRPEDPAVLRPCAGPAGSRGGIRLCAGLVCPCRRWNTDLCPRRTSRSLLLGPLNKKLAIRVTWQTGRKLAPGWLTAGSGGEPSAALPAQMPLSLAVPLAGAHDHGPHGAGSSAGNRWPKLQGEGQPADLLWADRRKPLLFAGVTVRQTLSGSIWMPVPSPFAWELKLTLLERSIKQQGGTWGWNHRLRPDTGSAGAAPWPAADRCTRPRARFFRVTAVWAS